MSRPAPTERTRLRRLPERGAHDAEIIRAILDEGLVCHVGFVHAGSPVVIPTAYARIGERLYLHGSSANRMLRSLRDGGEACVTVTLLDGLVLARSAFHHSMNFRSVVVFGRASEVCDPERKREVLRALLEHVLPGRSESTRAPNDTEMLRTLVLELPLDEASAKIRSGPPNDDDEDCALPHWAGEIPLRLVAEPPRPDPKLAPDVATPEAARHYERPFAR